MVDWLAFRSQSTVTATMGALEGAFGPYGRLVRAEARSRGYMGYERAADLSLNGMSVGLMAFGGESQRGWVMVSLSGRGCQWIDDWDRAEGALSELKRYQTRRVDVALDTRKREVTHESVIAAYHAGLFNARGAGRPPAMTRIESEGPGKGRTVCIGNRAQSKFFRGYEKGWELAKGFPAGVVPTHIDDVPIEDLYRCELELKPKESPLPVDLIERRDQYFAGGYPFLEHLLQVEPEIFVQRRERGVQFDLAAALANVRHQYGSTLFTALAAYHGDFMSVWDRIVGDKHNGELLAAGVLMVDHE